MTTEVSTLRNVSLRRRVLVLVLTAVSLGWCVIATVSYFDVHRRLDRVLDAHLAQTANLLLAQTDESLEERHGSGVIPSVGRSQPIVYQIWRRDGRLARRSSAAPLEHLSAAQIGWSDATLDGAEWRVYSQWDDERRYLIQVAEKHHGRERMAAGVALSSLLPLLIGLPLLGLLITWTITRACRPLVALADEVSARNARSLDPIGVHEIPAEVRPLVETFNDLMERVRRSLESERNFTADAAHEMRNPLAALRAQAEVARDAVERAPRRAALDRVIEAADRLSRLVEQLLQLARIEHLSSAGQRGPCRLDELARAVVADLAPLAVTKGGDLELEANTPVSVTGEPALLEVLIRNLVDNAIRHGGADNVVRVSVTDAAGAAVLEIADTGTGVSDTEIAHLGQRFFRGEFAQGAGSGLGLSIVRQIAKVHGADITFARGRGGRGLTVAVRFRGNESRR